MNNTLDFSSLRHPRGQDMTIAWETQPSLQHRVVRSESGHLGAPSWAETTPAAFDAFDDATDFTEPLAGLSIRHIHEPEIFRAFFGDLGVTARA